MSVVCHFKYRYLFHHSETHFFAQWAVYEFLTFMRYKPIILFSRVPIWHRQASDLPRLIM